MTTAAKQDEQERKVRAADAIAKIMAELRNPHSDLEIQEVIMLIDDALEEAGIIIGGSVPQDYASTHAANAVPFRRNV